jgi:esterase/lipase
MNIEKISFLNNESQKIAAKIHTGAEKSLNGVIFCHGMFSSKDGYKITNLAEHIVNAGFTLLTFDFSFAGESEGNMSELSVFQEVDDLNSAFFFFKKYGMKQIHVIGSSLGGLVSLLFSSILKKEISSQTLIAAPVLLDDLLYNMLKTTDINSIPDTGYTEVEGIKIHNKFFKETLKINIDNAINNIMTPTMIIHGAEDNVVSVNNAIALIKCLNTDKRIILIDGGDHNLTRDSDLKVLRENILEWLKSHSS